MPESEPADSHEPHSTEEDFLNHADEEVFGPARTQEEDFLEHTDREVFGDREAADTSFLANADREIFGDTNAKEKAFLNNTDQEVFGGKEALGQAEYDKGQLALIEQATHEQAAAAAAAQQRSEATARANLADIQDQLPGQMAALKEQMEGEHPEDVQAGLAFNQLHANLASRKLDLLIPTGEDDAIHRQIYQKVFDDLGLSDPIPELEADKRSWLRKLFRRPNRTTTRVGHYLTDEAGQEAFIYAVRQYDATTGKYALSLAGGAPSEHIKQQFPR